MGGLAGRNDGTISRSFVTGSVSGFSSDGGPFYIGGLVGVNNGTIDTAYANVIVTAGDDAVGVGGLAGSNNGSITDAYALGAVTAGSGADGVGGLVGLNDGTILAHLLNRPGHRAARAFSRWIGRVNDGRLDPQLVLGQQHVRPEHQCRRLAADDLAVPGHVRLHVFGWRSGLEFPDHLGPAERRVFCRALRPEPGDLPAGQRCDRVEGTANPTFTYVGPFGGPGSVHSVLRETASISRLHFRRPAGLGSPAGLYPVTGSATATSSGGVSYRLFAIPATLTVTPAPPTSHHSVEPGADRRRVAIRR